MIRIHPIPSVRVVSLALGVLAPLPACDDADAPQGPAAPRAFEAAAVPGGAHLTWQDASDDEDEFAIERAADGGEFEEIATVPFDTTQYHDDTVTAGSWRYRVGARNDDGEQWSDEVGVTIE
ncbi:MAG: hypothetical protein K1X88_04485 [Nannocystaceae bacterium]|nr:hypothetical protein [Nannocystaceae bacterium]